MPTAVQTIVEAMYRSEQPALTAAEIATLIGKPTQRACRTITTAVYDGALEVAGKRYPTPGSKAHGSNLYRLSMQARNAMRMKIAAA